MSERVPIACRFVPYDQWFVTHLDRTWKVHEAKHWLLSKCVPLLTADADVPPKRRPVSPITFAPNPHLTRRAPDTGDDDDGLLDPDDLDDFDLLLTGRYNPTLGPSRRELQRSRTRLYTPTLPAFPRIDGLEEVEEDDAARPLYERYALLRFSSGGQALEDQHLLSWYELIPHELFELHAASAPVALHRGVMNEYVTPYVEVRVKSARVAWGDRRWKRAFERIIAEEMEAERGKGKGKARAKGKGKQPAGDVPRGLKKKQSGDGEEDEERWVVVHGGALSLRRDRTDARTAFTFPISTLCGVRGADDMPSPPLPSIHPHLHPNHQTGGLPPRSFTVYAKFTRPRPTRVASHGSIQRARSTPSSPPLSPSTSSRTPLHHAFSDSFALGLHTSAFDRDQEPDLVPLLSAPRPTLGAPSGRGGGQRRMGSRKKTGQSADRGADTDEGDTEGACAAEAVTEEDELTAYTSADAQDSEREGGVWVTLEMPDEYAHAALLRTLHRLAPRPTALVSDALPSANPFHHDPDTWALGPPPVRPALGTSPSSPVRTHAASGSTSSTSSAHGSVPTSSSIDLGGGSGSGFTSVTSASASHLPPTPASAPAFKPGHARRPSGLQFDADGAGSGARLSQSVDFGRPERATLAEAGAVAPGVLPFPEWRLALAKRAARVGMGHAGRALDYLRWGPADGSDDEDEDADASSYVDLIVDREEDMGEGEESFPFDMHDGRSVEGQEIVFDDRSSRTDDDPTTPHPHTHWESLLSRARGDSDDEGDSFRGRRFGRVTDDGNDSEEGSEREWDNWVGDLERQTALRRAARQRAREREDGDAERAAAAALAAGNEDTLSVFGAPIVASPGLQDFDLPGDSTTGSANLAAGTSAPAALNILAGLSPESSVSRKASPVTLFAPSYPITRTTTTISPPSTVRSSAGSSNSRRMRRASEKNLRKSSAKSAAASPSPPHSASISSASGSASGEQSQHKGRRSFILQRRKSSLSMAVAASAEPVSSDAASVLSLSPAPPPRNLSGATYYSGPSGYFGAERGPVAAERSRRPDRSPRAERSPRTERSPQVGRTAVAQAAGVPLPLGETAGGEPKNRLGAGLALVRGLSVRAERLVRSGSEQAGEER